MTNRPLIAISLGDPSGIGPEVIAKALAKPDIYNRSIPFVVGSVAGFSSVKDRLIEIGIQLRAIQSFDEISGEHGTIEILIDDDKTTAAPNVFPLGEISTKSAIASHHWVERAARLCQVGSVAAMVTAPVNKTAWHLAGMSPDIGHQEVFKRMSGSNYVATMLVSGSLRCMHLSTHKSLREACDYVTRENVLRAIKLTDSHFRQWGYDSPHIAVAGLNPHASDNGLIGSEEQEEISPAISEAVKGGIQVTGPVPADSVFHQAIEGLYDVVVVMYHDQGHIAIKVHGFEESISVNLGIPWIRTSVDHGTAFDIAGKWLADETSMTEAINTATDLSSGKIHTKASI